MFFDVNRSICLEITKNVKYIFLLILKLSRIFLSCLVALLFMHHWAEGYHFLGLSWIYEISWFLSVFLLASSLWYPYFFSTPVIVFESSMTTDRVVLQCNLPVIIWPCNSTAFPPIAIVSLYYPNNLGRKEICAWYICTHQTWISVIEGSLVFHLGSLALKMAN